MDILSTFHACREGTLLTREKSHAPPGQPLLSAVYVGCPLEGRLICCIAGISLPPLHPPLPPPDPLLVSATVLCDCKSFGTRPTSGLAIQKQEWWRLANTASKAQPPTHLRFATSRAGSGPTVRRGPALCNSRRHPVSCPGVYFPRLALGIQPAALSAPAAGNQTRPPLVREGPTTTPDI